MHPDQLVTVTLSAADWQVVLMGLGDVPLKFSRPVDDRLRQQLQAAEQAAPAIPAFSGNGEERRAP